MRFGVHGACAMRAAAMTERTRPPRDHIMQYFAFAHLPVRLQGVSQPFCDVAQWIEQSIPRNPERTVALRKLLEAKDACVRASVAIEHEPLPEGVGPKP